MWEYPNFYSYFYKDDSERFIKYTNDTYLRGFFYDQYSQTILSIIFISKGAMPSVKMYTFRIFLCVCAQNKTFMFLKGIPDTEWLFTSEGLTHILGFTVQSVTEVRVTKTMIFFLFHSIKEILWN